MKTEINGLAVFTEGDPNNQPIIFVHGFPYNHTMWNFQIDALKNSYYCVSYDVRGLGESAVGDGQYTMEFYAEDLLTIIKELKLNKPILCTLSMGGYIALRAVEKEQDTFSGLILCDTRSEADDNASKLKRTAIINTINNQGLNSFVEPFVKLCFADETPLANPKLFNSTLEECLKNNPLGVKGAVFALVSRTDTTEFLPKIKLPTLVICGAFDRITPPPVMRNLADGIMDSEFAAIPAAGHMSPLENPLLVNDLISGFIKRRIV